MASTFQLSSVDQIDFPLNLTHVAPWKSLNPINLILTELDYVSFCEILETSKIRNEGKKKRKKACLNT